MAIETERKFLIRYPDAEILAEAIGSEIEQIYLSPECDSGFDNDRVRKRVYEDKISYTRTRKKRISLASAIEDEKEISREEYEKLSLNIEAGSNKIIKTRYVLPYRGFDFEIDVYPFWNDRAVLEVELPGEDTEFTFPTGISVIKELTGDKRYSNHALAFCVPNEEI